MSQNETQKIDDLAIPEADSQGVTGGGQNNLKQIGVAIHNHQDASPYNPYVTVDAPETTRTR